MVCFSTSLSASTESQPKTDFPKSSSVKYDFQLALLFALFWGIFKALLLLKNKQINKSKEAEPIFTQVEIYFPGEFY